MSNADVVALTQIELKQARGLYEKVRVAGDQLYQQRELLPASAQPELVGAISQAEDTLLSALHDAQERMQRLEIVLAREG
ncbi:hypothetical protein, partial [Sansalvadorimonas verongulae]|uniref:hypothetical protein n=1 Tax=Sansalvadorimonas verongulae TaxID=2172824 RepID=UPI0012BBAE4D